MADDRTSPALIADIDKTLARDFPEYASLANPEPLAVADRDVCAPLSRRGEEGQAEKVRRDGDQSSDRVRLLSHRASHDLLGGPDTAAPVVVTSPIWLMDMPWVWAVPAPST